jgi:hypothetical protein
VSGLGSVKRIGRVSFRRIRGTLNWRIDTDEPFLLLAEHEALEWMQREYSDKKKVKGGLVNKASGILTELIFNAMLDELNVPHVTNETLLSKRHPVNIGKIFDFKLADGRTIDVKALPPYQYRENMNVNQWEVDNIGVCDFYVLFKCSGEYTEDDYVDIRDLDKRSARLMEELLSEPNCEEIINEFNSVKERLHHYIGRISKVDFIAYVAGSELVKPGNLKPGKYGFGYYYGLTVHYENGDKLMSPFHSQKEFAGMILCAQL